MAFIPDEAIDDSFSLTPSAFRLYCLLCRRRDHSDRLSRLKPVRAMEILHLGRTQFFDAQKTLVNDGWIRIITEGEFDLLKGNFSPVEFGKADSHSSEKRTVEFGKADSHSSEKRTVEFGKTDSPLKEYPASLSSLSNPAHTSTTKRAVSADNNGSMFSLDECFRYVQICVSKGENIKSPKGLATSLFQSGTSDAFILATLYPDRLKEVDRENFGEPRIFSGEPCVVCLGAKMANIGGKGYSKCLNCQNEKGVATGFEPLQILNEINRQNELKRLKEFQSDGDDLSEYQKFYSEDDWKWLMDQINKTAT